MPRRVLLPVLLAATLIVALWPASPLALGAGADGQLVYLALGDSVPSGEGIGDDGGYPRRLGQ